MRGAGLLLVLLLAGTGLPGCHRPVVPPATPETRTGFYGLGWNVSYDDRGRVQIGHSGAFNLGAATSVLMLPGEELGIDFVQSPAQDHHNRQRRPALRRILQLGKERD